MERGKQDLIEDAEKLGTDLTNAINEIPLIENIHGLRLPQTARPLDLDST